MNWFEMIKKYYDNQLWTIDQVKVSVEKNKITKEEFKQITGEDYII